MNSTIEMNDVAKTANRDFYHQVITELNITNQIQDDSLFIINRAEVRNRYQLIQELLPSCTHYFAVKSCPQKSVVEEINNVNGYFDIASSGEIKLLQDAGIDMKNCIHTHPIKPKNEILKAIDAGITTFVIDNEDELLKFDSYKANIKLLLRLSFSNSDAKIDLSSKFGIEPKHTLAFIIKAVMQGYQIQGLCFHVGSQMPSNDMYLKALDVCNEIFSEAKHIGIHLNTIDIGGGFPFFADQTDEELHDFYHPIDQYLQTYFKGVNCMAEPGRFISTPVATLICKVVGKSIRNKQYNYYLNEGVYGCLSNKIFDFYDLKDMYIPSTRNQKNAITFASTLFGPTCDSIDVIAAQYELPELQIDDMILFGNMGAYTIASTTDFNMLGQSQVINIDIA
jgi:ornithine decarboxylase